MSDLDELSEGEVVFQTLSGQIITINSITYYFSRPLTKDEKDKFTDYVSSARGGGPLTLGLITGVDQVLIGIKAHNGPIRTGKY